MTEQKTLSEEAIETAIAYVRNPNKELRATERMKDLYEIGGRRFLGWLQCKRYIILKLEQDQRRLTQEQVREYIARYYPQMGEVDIEVDGIFVTVREKTDEGGA